MKPFLLVILIAIIGAIAANQAEQKMPALTENQVCPIHFEDEPCQTCLISDEIQDDADQRQQFAELGEVGQLYWEKTTCFNCHPKRKPGKVCPDLPE